MNYYLYIMSFYTFTCDLLFQLARKRVICQFGRLVAECGLRIEVSQYGTLVHVQWLFGYELYDPFGLEL